jgi:hypothetical protein
MAMTSTANVDSPSRNAMIQGMSGGSLYFPDLIIAPPFWSGICRAEARRYT